MNFSVTKNNSPLDPSLYTWDEGSKTFSSEEDDLVLDFSSLNGVTFKVSSHCTFKTNSFCTFNTGSRCTFETGSNCTFDTGSYCTFRSGSDCTFDTYSNCIFKTGSNCTFDTGSDCTFDTGSKSVVIRRDFFQVIQLIDNGEVSFKKDTNILFDGIEMSLNEYNEFLKVRVL